MDLELFKNPIFTQKIKKYVEFIMERSLLGEEINLINAVIDDNNLDIMSMGDRQIIHIIRIIGKWVLAKISDTKNTEYNVSSIMNMNVQQIARSINPSAFHKKAYVVLDRRYRTLENTDRTIVSWNINYGANIYNNALTVQNGLKNIISMRLYDYVLNDTYMFGYTRHNFATLLIHELQSQSFITSENRRFHFYGCRYSGRQVYTARTDDTIINTPSTEFIGSYTNYARATDGNSGQYEFVEPIQNLSTISISIGMPFQPISFYTDTMSFAYTAAATIVTTLPHNYVSGIPSRVYISNFNTDNLVADATLISYLNRTSGWLGTYVNSTTLTLSASNDEDAVVFPAMVGVQSAGAIIYLEYHRFYIGIEFTYLNDNDLLYNI